MPEDRLLSRLYGGEGRWAGCDNGDMVGGRNVLDEDELREGAGLEFIARNREEAANGVSYRGVAIVWRANGCAFRNVPLKNPEKFEVLVGAGSLHGHSRRLIVLACYLPPNYDRTRGMRVAEFVLDTVIEMKRRFKDPYIIIAGDFNQWRMDFADLADVEEVPVGNTRGSHCIDRILSNIARKVTEAGTLAPLETETDRQSDHRVAFCTVSLPRQEAFRWESYTYRHYNDEALQLFKEWIVLYEWTDVLSKRGSENKARKCQDVLNKAIERFFSAQDEEEKEYGLALDHGWH